MIHTLPLSFQKILSDPRGPGAYTGLAFSLPGLKIQIQEFYPDWETMSQCTNIMAQSFMADCYYGEHPQRDEWLADITDFSSIVCIGHDIDHAPICLDYRDGSPDPQVIYFDGVGWRKIAQSFEEFLNQTS